MVVEKYPLIIEKDDLGINALRYKVQVYSNGKPLTFIIDSGSEKGIISSESLDGTDYNETGQCNSVFSVNGKMSFTKGIILQFDFDKTRSLNHNCSFGLDFDVMDVSTKIYGCSGVLGVNFLQLCRLDFLSGNIQIHYL